MNDTVKRPTTEEVNNVLAGSATKEVAKHVAEWFATPEGVSFIESTMTKDKDNIIEGAEEIYVGHIIPTKKIQESINQTIKRKRSLQVIYRIAAVFIPVAFISAISVYLLSSPDIIEAEYTDIYIAKGEQLRIELSDGSIVCFNSDTHFRYPVEFVGKQREVYLDGEAYFEVESDRSNPFIVHIDKSQIEVTGTRFNVEAYNEEDDVVVSLYEGSVTFDISESKCCNLIPGQTLSYEKSRDEYIVVNNESDAPAWKSRQMSFKDTPFIEITKTLERWFDVKFIYKSPQVVDYLYSLTLSDPTLESALYDLGKISPLYFEYNISEKRVYVTLGY